MKMTKRTLLKPAKGFTLVELLVVISIIAILSVIGITIFTSAQKSARDAKRKGDVEAISKAMEQYKLVNGSYPLQNSYPAPCSNAWSTHACWTLPGMNLTGYMMDLPKDPLNTDKGNCGNAGDASQVDCHMYRYCSVSNGTSFILGVNMENSTGLSSIVPCPLAGNNPYYVYSQQ